MIDGRPEVLFLCVHNAGRSQMAAALLERYANGRVVTRSGGTAPADEINPTVAVAMAEIGVDLVAAGARPHALTADAARAAAVVVTMGCGDTCPYFPGTTYADWPVDDPAGQPIEKVRQIRDDIDTRVGTLLAGLVE